MPQRKPFTPFEQGVIYGLHKHANWPLQQIATKLNTTKGAISKLICRVEREPRTPPLRGRPPVLTTRKRQRLVNRLTIDAFHRRLRIDQIGQLEGFNFCIRTLRRALQKEGYSRRPAQRKPFLTERHKAERLQWAQEHVNWSDRQWERVLWTDEASVRCGYWGQVYVTRRQDETFNEDCLIARFRKYSACMIWGSISQSGPKELFIFEQGSVDGMVFRRSIVPLIQKATTEMQQEGGIFGFNQRAVIMQDGASLHTAKATRDLFLSKELDVMKWPAQSPDLNPIENIWSLLKHRIGLHFPRDREAVIRAARLEWSRLTVSDTSRACQSMRQRCQAVIDTQGGHTRW